LIRQPRSQFPAMRKSHSKRWSKRKSSPSLRKRDFILPKMIGSVARLSSTTAILRSRRAEYCLAYNSRRELTPARPSNSRIPVQVSHLAGLISTPFGSASHLSEARAKTTARNARRRSRRTYVRATYNSTLCWFFAISGLVELLATSPNKVL